MHLRRATSADADELATTVSEGFASYLEFAPPGWRAPDRLELAIGLAGRLRRPSTRAWLAEVGDEVAGHVTWLPASESRKPSAEPGLAHLEQLFVRRAHWGSGVAWALHAAMVEEASRRGFSEVRLFTPVEQRRARRFYEREGWRAVAGRPAPHLGFDVVEYRLTCPTPS